jgi:hypothetical protein
MYYMHYLHIFLSMTTRAHAKQIFTYHHSKQPSPSKIIVHSTDGYRRNNE